MCVCGHSTSAQCDEDKDGLLSYRDFERGVAQLDEGEQALDVELAEADESNTIDATLRNAFAALSDDARVERVRLEAELKELSTPLPLADDDSEFTLLL